MTDTIVPPDGQLSFSGIPTAEFIEDVDSHMAAEEVAESQLKVLDERHQKYKFMETNLINRRRRLKGQIPDIKSSLILIEHLREKSESKEEIESHFLISDQAYSKAVIPPTNKVCLWLGANVMLEYPLDEAEQLLKKNLDSAESSIQQTAFDLDFLRDQMTITEVTMARLYNWDVKKRQTNKAANAVENATS